MSLKRYVYYCAVAGGWAAFFAWLLAEMLFLHRQSLGGIAEVLLAGGLVGAAIGAALNVVSGMTNPQWKRQLQRAPSGLVGGCVGGALGGLVGAMVYDAIQPEIARAIGWMVMGLGIGIADGIYQKSSSKIRHGLIGGLLGGLVGGLLFDPIAGAGTGMFSRATAFVILGLCIGVLIGLIHVVLKQAWLTVLDGFRPGRQLILDQPITILGRGDHLPLPFLGYADKDLESEHLRIIRQADGRYALEDNRSRLGTQVNNNAVQGHVLLCDGDLIRLGTNIVRFNHRRREQHEAGQAVGTVLASAVGAIPAPPPPPGIPGMPQPSSQGAARQPGSPLPPQVGSNFPPPLPNTSQRARPGIAPPPLTMPPRPFPSPPRLPGAGSVIPPPPPPPA